jgi:hypothetical protein
MALCKRESLLFTNVSSRIANLLEPVRYKLEMAQRKGLWETVGDVAVLLEAPLSQLGVQIPDHRR